MKRLSFLLAIVFCPLMIHGQTAFTLKRTFSESNHQVTSASFSQHGKYIITTGSDKNIIIWNSETGIIYRTLAGLNNSPVAAIFKTRDAMIDAPQGVQQLYDLPSRKAMTSGILQVVPDESTFMKYLVEKLNSNYEKFLPSELLFSNLKTAVMNNSTNVPQYGVIQNVGDEGGDFIFMKK